MVRGAENLDWKSRSIWLSAQIIPELDIVR